MRHLCVFFFKKKKAANREKEHCINHTQIFLLLLCIVVAIIIISIPFLSFIVILMCIPCLAHGTHKPYNKNQFKVNDILLCHDFMLLMLFFTCFLFSLVFGRKKNTKYCDRVCCYFYFACIPKSEVCRYYFCLFIFTFFFLNIMRKGDYSKNFVYVSYIFCCVSLFNFNVTKMQMTLNLL